MRVKKTSLKNEYTKNRFLYHKLLEEIDSTHKRVLSVMYTLTDILDELKHKGDEDTIKMVESKLSIVTDFYDQLGDM